MKTNQHRRVIAGVDIIAEAERLIRLKEFRDTFVETRTGKTGKPRRYYVLPEIVVRQSQTKDDCSGRCTPSQRRIVMTLSKDADAAEVCILLLHELCHFGCGDGKVHAHNAAYKSLLAKAAYEAYGVDACPDQSCCALDYEILGLLRERSRRVAKAMK